MPKLTIGMAHFEDYHGVYFTIQSLRLHHPEVMKDVEFVVIDNSPDSSHGEHLERSIRGWAHIGTAGAQYYPLKSPTGTSCSRNKIFEMATGDAVLAIDCHVMFPANSIKRLIDFYDENPTTKDIYTGPLIYDSLDNKTTHFNDEWRGEMWGTWGSAWTNGEGIYFSVLQEGGKCKFIALAMGQVPVTRCGKTELPEDLDWPNHEKTLEELGLTRAGINVDDEPFKITGQGLGVFSCRRDAWLGFNEDARGFGGEELYIHEKYRQAGNDAYLLPFLPWLHRFARPDGVKYNLSRYGKVRNYVLEFMELGRSLDPIYDHFVETGLLSKPEWKRLLLNPVLHEHPQDEKAVPKTGSGCGSCEANAKAAMADLANMLTVEAVFDKMKSIPRDLEQHMDFLKEISSKCSHVTEISKRKESLVALAAGKPKKIVSYNTEGNHPIIEQVEKVLPEIQMKLSSLPSSEIETIEKTDLLFIDTIHTYDEMMNELNKFAPMVKRFIVARGTQSNGEIGEDGGRGILHALRLFMQENPKWSIIEHHEQQYGISVLARLKKDKPKLPSITKMAGNLAIALKEHIATGSESTSKEKFEKRLEICSMCTHRTDKQCSICGCFVDKKAMWAESECPIGKWDLEDATKEVK
tara:strand:+ start:4330 stop:6237 length:1908 start_codon:yes stop_codon:yes gene_type:complete